MRARGLMGLLMGPMGPIGLIGLMGLMGLGLMGCSGDSPEQAPEPAKAETAIAFASGLEEEQAVTRAAMPLSEQAVTRTTPLSEKTQRFTVWGYKNMSCDEKNNTDPSDDDYAELQTVFPGYNVGWTSGSSATSTTNSSGWDYVNQLSSTGVEQTIKYWDWSAKAYRFFAVTGDKGATAAAGTYVDNGVNGSTGAYEITLYANGSSEEGIAATPYYSHLWFSTGDPSIYADRQFGKPVQLEFLKPFAKVRFKFIFEDPNLAKETTLTDKSFRPTDGRIIKTNGQVTVGYPLTGTAVTETLTISSDAGGITEFTQDYYEEADLVNEGGHVVSPYFDAPETPLGKEYAVLPATVQGTYTLTVSVNGEPKTTVVPAEFMNWKVGYLYTYIFKVHVDGGVSIDVVQSAFTPWMTGNTTDHTVYNW